MYRMQHSRCLLQLRFWPLALLATLNVQLHILVHSWPIVLGGYYTKNTIYSCDIYNIKNVRGPTIKCTHYKRYHTFAYQDEPRHESILLFFSAPLHSPQQFSSHPLVAQSLLLSSPGFQYNRAFPLPLWSCLLFFLNFSCITVWQIFSQSWVGVHFIIWELRILSHFGLNWLNEPWDLLACFYTFPSWQLTRVLIGQSVVLL